MMQNALVNVSNGRLELKPEHWNVKSEGLESGGLDSGGLVSGGLEFEGSKIWGSRDSGYGFRIWICT